MRCTEGGQKNRIWLEHPSNQKIYAGTLQCPSDFFRFCQQQYQCPNHCSSKGLCIRSSCLCLPDFQNDMCSQPCPAECLSCGVDRTCASCPPTRYFAANKTCICLDGFYESALKQQDCRKCHYTCTKCSGATSCDECPATRDSPSQLCPCKMGYFELEIYRQQLCLLCDKNCLRCKHNATFCI